MGRGIDLYYAVDRGDLEDAKRLIIAGDATDYKDHGGCTALHLACMRGYTEIVKLLIINNVNVNVKTNYGVTPLHFSCGNGYIEITRLLIDVGADVNARDHSGVPLHEACRAESVNIMELLILHKADIEAKNQLGRSLLYIACTKNNIRMVELLIQNKINIHAKCDDGMHPLHVPCMWNDIAMIKLLINYGAKNYANNDGQTAFMFVCSVEAAQIFLEKKLVDDIKAKDRFGYNVLYHALSSGVVELAEFLMNNGVKDVDKSCFFDAIRSGRSEVVKFMLEKRLVDANAEDSNNRTALYIACCHNESIAKLLLEYDVNNTPTRHDETPFIKAVEQGMTEVVQLMLEKGIVDDINNKHAHRNAPLYSACQQGNSKMAILLLEYAFSKAHTADLTEYCIIAIEKGMIDVVKLMITSGVVDMDHALHNAYAKKNYQIAKLIILYGACISDTYTEMPDWINDVRAYQKMAREMKDMSDGDWFAMNYNVVNDELYWLAMINDVMVTGEFDKRLYSYGNKMYDEAVKAAWFKGLVTESAEFYNKLHLVKNLGAVDCFKNPFLSIHVKNQLFLNGFSWWNKDNNGKYVFNQETLDEINESIIYGKKLQLLKLKPKTEKNKADEYEINLQLLPPPPLASTDKEKSCTAEGVIYKKNLQLLPPPPPASTDKEKSCTAEGVIYKKNLQLVQLGYDIDKDKFESLTEGSKYSKYASDVIINRAMQERGEYINTHTKPYVELLESVELKKRAKDDIVVQNRTNLLSQEILQDLQDRIDLLNKEKPSKVVLRDREISDDIFERFDGLKHEMVENYKPKKEDRTEQEHIEYVKKYTKPYIELMDFIGLDKREKDDEQHKANLCVKGMWKSFERDEYVASETFQGLLEYAEGLAKTIGPARFDVIYKLCNNLDNKNHDIFDSVKRFYPQIANFKCIQNYDEYQHLRSITEVYYDQEKRKMEMDDLKEWHYNKDREGFDIVSEFFVFLGKQNVMAYGYDTQFDYTHFDDLTVTTMMDWLFENKAI